MPLYFNLTSKRKKNRLKVKTSANKFIVSLTTFPKRIDKVWLVIESILRQEEKPDKIILWLYKEEFNGIESLPKKLLKLRKRGLEIRFCDENLKPHKKYYYAIKEYPDSNLIIIDDDFIYPPNLLKNLINSHEKYPKAIICSMSREIIIKEGVILPYIKWKRVGRNTKPLFRNSILGGGGTLFPPNSLNSKVLDLNEMEKLSFEADDLWLKIMSLKQNTKVVSLEGEYKRPFFKVNIRDNITLADSNLREGNNDIIFQKLINFYNIQLSRFKD
jgi:hypothetical protein